MATKMITLLNTSILTAFGRYTYDPVSLNKARELVATHEIVQSAIGHDSTAAILTDLLGIPVSVNRINYNMLQGEHALVFKLRGRAPEGTILSREEIEKIGYDFGLLARLRD